MDSHQTRLGSRWRGPLFGAAFALAALLLAAMVYYASALIVDPLARTAASLVVRQTGVIPPPPPPEPDTTLVRLALAVAVLGAVVGLSAARSWRISQGGSSFVAASLGAVPLEFDSRLAGGRTRLSELALAGVVSAEAAASGLPDPDVYVLPDDDGVNALSAGLTPDDSAVIVTKEALDRLSPDELASVIARELVRMRNGDTRLFTLMGGWLHGLFAIPMFVNRALSRLSDPRFLVPGALLLTPGAVCWLLGRALQAAFGRGRQTLADAASVRIARNPKALAGALKKIGGHPEASRVRSPAASALGPLFVSNPHATSWFAAHPPLAERIWALDPAWDGWYHDFDLDPSDSRAPTAAPPPPPVVAAAPSLAPPIPSGAPPAAAAPPPPVAGAAPPPSGAPPAAAPAGQAGRDPSGRFGFDLLACAVVVLANLWWIGTTGLALACVASWAGDPSRHGLPGPSPIQIALSPAIMIIAAVAGAVSLASSWRRARRILDEGSVLIATSLGAVPLSPPPRPARDPALQREDLLAEVVDSLAAATGIPAPDVYVLPNDYSLNCLAAGLDPDDWAVVVTKGALKHLSRDELAGLVGLGFARMARGDLRRLTLLAGWVHGLLTIHIRARRALGAMQEEAGDRPLVGTAAAFFLAGAYGWLLGSAILRFFGRVGGPETDAAAAAFAGSPRALAGALKKIGGHQRGGRVKSPAASDLDQLFAVDTGIVGWLGAHRRLADRIWDLDPGWDGWWHDFDRDPSDYLSRPPRVGPAPPGQGPPPSAPRP